MQQSRFSTPQVAGVLVSFLGTTIALGWLFDVEAIAHLIPDSTRLGIVNPLLFVSIGLCFFSHGGEGVAHAVLRRLSLLCIAGAILLPLGYLFEGVTAIPIGIDLVHGGMLPSPANPYPGRLSANASLGFLFAGIAFALARRPLVGKRRWAFSAAAAGIAAISLAGLVGHFVGLEMLYKVANFNRILPTTAAGLLVVAAGLWGMLGESSVDAEPVAATERRINRRSIAVLTFVTLAGGIAGFSVMRDTFEQSISQNLMLTATTSATSLGHALEVSLWFSRTVTTRPMLIQTLDKLDRNPHDQAAKAYLQKIADSFRSADIAGSEFYDTSGRLIVTAGSTVRSQAAVTHPLNNPGQKAALLWMDGYVLVADTVVLDEGRPVGRVITEQRMPLFDRLLMEVRASNATADAAICSREGQQAVCAPNRLRPSTFTVPMFDANGTPTLPVVQALLGERGVTRVKDRRGIEVVSAFSPIQDYGLGFAVKTDVETLYAPLRTRVNALVMVLVAIIALALFVQRSHVRPVLAQLVESQQRLRTQQALLTRMGQVAGVGAWELDPLSGELTWNEETRRIHEVGPDFVPTLAKAVAFYAPEAQSAITKAVEVGMERGEPWTLELPLVTATGRHIWVRAQGEAEIQDGQPVRLFGAIQDISAAKAAEQALRDSEHRLRMVADHLPVLISYLDQDLCFRFVNRTYRQWFGPEGGPAIGSSVQAFYGEHAWGDIEPHLRAALAGENVAYDREMVLEDGRRHVQVTAVPDRNEEGQVAGLYTLIADVTADREAEQALQESESRLRTMADALPMRVAYIDADERYRFNNLAYERGFGKSRDELYGRTVRELLGDTAYGAAEPRIRTALRGEPVTFQSEMVSGDNYVCYEAHYIPQFAADGHKVVGFHAVVTDITRQKLEEKRLIELARVDPLTGVINRAGFELRVAEAMQRCRAKGALMALMYIDIDRFKQINDRFGHDTGDTLLRAFAHRLKQTLRSSDIIARLGGDEFTVIMEGLPGAEAASTIAAKIVHAMGLPFALDQQTISVTTSIGLAFYQGDATTAQMLIKQADVMLYQAKGAGRNNVQVAFRVIEGGKA